MNEQELRAIVREAVARHLGQASPGVPNVGLVSAAEVCRSGSHPSHTLYTQLVNVTDACVIEPAVRCDHCGYCKSHGY